METQKKVLLFKFDSGRNEKTNMFIKCDYTGGFMHYYQSPLSLQVVKLTILGHRLIWVRSKNSYSGIYALRKGEFEVI